MVGRSAARSDAVVLRKRIGLRNDQSSRGMSELGVGVHELRSVVRVDHRSADAGVLC